MLILMGPSHLVTNHPGYIPILWIHYIVQRPQEGSSAFRLQSNDSNSPYQGRRTYTQSSRWQSYGTVGCCQIPTLGSMACKSQLMWSRVHTEDGLDMSERDLDKFNKGFESARWKLLMTWLSTVRPYLITHFLWPPGESHILSLK
jgi:hypothetical protein